MKIDEEIPGWFNFEDVYDLAVAKSNQNDILVELGAFLGKSTSYLASKVRDSNKNLELYVVDTFVGSDGEDWMKECIKWANPNGTIISNFVNNLEKQDLLRFIKLLNIDSSKAAKFFDDLSVHFVYVDACHQYEKVVEDIKAWLPKIKRNGIIAGHDIHLPDVKEAVEQLIPNYQTLGASWIYEQA